MISVVVLFRNAPAFIGVCLESLLHTIRSLGLDASTAYVLVDDCSDLAAGIPDLLKQFREQAPSPVSVIRFREHRHYAYGLAYALSVARGDVLFVSHDMALTPACLKTMLAVGASDPGIGIIRPTSQHMDISLDLTLSPPLPPRSTQDVNAFGDLVERRFGNEVVQHPILIGDAMYIRRSVIDKIGVFDTRYFGFLADIDYGLRALRAGFRLVVARGAWLHHEGSGHMKALVGAARQSAAKKIAAESVAALEVFRAKWDRTIPNEFGLDWMERLRLAQLNVREYEPPLAFDPAICEML